MSFETYDTKDRVTVTTVTNSFVDHTVFVCRFLPRGILQLGHTFLRLAKIDQRETWRRLLIK
jgi:hypothetical protein